MHSGTVGGGKAEKAAITISDWVADSRVDSRVEKTAEHSRAETAEQSPTTSTLPQTATIACGV